MGYGLWVMGYGWSKMAKIAGSLKNERKMQMKASCRKYAPKMQIQNHRIYTKYI